MYYLQGTLIRFDEESNNHRVTEDNLLLLCGVFGAVREVRINHGVHGVPRSFDTIILIPP